MFIIWLLVNIILIEILGTNLLTLVTLLVANGVILWNLDL